MTNLNPDQFKEPFEEIAKNRLVRIGNRTYPAVATRMGDDYRWSHANLVFENGNLVSVGYHPKTHPDKPWEVVDTYTWKTHATPEEVHETLDEMATKSIPAVQLEGNRVMVKANQKWNAAERARPHYPGYSGYSGETDDRDL